MPLEDQVQEDPLLLLLEEDAVEEVDKIELNEISPVAKRRKKDHDCSDNYHDDYCDDYQEA